MENGPKLFGAIAKEKGKMEIAIAECDMKRTAIIELLKMAIADGDAEVPQDIASELTELDKLEKEKDRLILGLLVEVEFMGTAIIPSYFPGTSQ